MENKLFSNADSISSEMKKGATIALVNHCIQQIRSGNTPMRDNLASFTLLGLDQGIYLKNNRLSETGFLNVIDILSHSNNQVNHNDFIAKWIPKVKLQDSTSIENMAHAMWSFAKDDYGDALRRLNVEDVKFNRLNISLRARWIRLCSLCALYEEYDE